MAGNKSDNYIKEEVNDKESKSLAKELNAIYFRTSAKLNNSIDELFNNIGLKFLQPNMEITSNLTKEELIQKTEKLRRDKIRNKSNGSINNNSVWNYRFFLINYINGNEIKDNIIYDEIKYALNKIKECVNNESAYCYLRGWIIKMKKKFNDYPEIKNELLELCKNNEVNHIHSMLLDIYEEEGNKEKEIQKEKKLVLE